MDWKETPPIDSSELLPGLDPVITRALRWRGIISPEMALGFLDPKRYTPATPGSIPGLSEMADRLVKTFGNKLSICVWGDFDVDGQTSTAILVQTLQTLEANVIYHIPVREKEGHGVNIPMLKEIIDRGTKMILTCDTGISASEAVNYARSRGVDVLITDHHDLPDELPSAAGIIDPKLLPEGHPLSTLSGAGLAYKLAEELFSRVGRAGEARSSLDLAALGMVADLARLIGDARYIVQLGLTSLRNTRRLGIRTMMDLAELDPENLTEEHIGFVLGPRLNALGRLGDANPAVDLFCTSDPIRARVIATQLEGLNLQRQMLCRQVTRAAEAQLQEQSELLGAPILILSNPFWPAGVIGIVASRLVERYQKPTILFSAPVDGRAHGSARSIQGFDITQAIAAQKDLLAGFGGHPMAAGLSLATEKLPEFTQRIQRSAEDRLSRIEGRDEVRIEGWFGLDELTEELAQTLERLAPFGPGNEKPVLATHAVKILSRSVIGKNKEHLKLEIADEAGNSRTVLWWSGAEELGELPEGMVDIAYTLRAADWRGKPEVQMELVDVHLLEAEKVEIKRQRVEVIDYRGAKDPLAILAEVKKEPSTLVWAEGVQKKAVGGCDRTELVQAQNLVIWTIPASLKLLQDGLEAVSPMRVYLFCVEEPADTAETFIQRLAGMVKYAASHKNGLVTYSTVAAALAQTSLTIQKGVEWLASQGQIEVKETEVEWAIVERGTPGIDIKSGDHLQEIRSLLAETNAFRSFFKQAEVESLDPILASPATKPAI